MFLLIKLKDYDYLSELLIEVSKIHLSLTGFIFSHQYKKLSIYVAEQLRDLPSAVYNEILLMHENGVCCGEFTRKQRRTVNSLKPNAFPNRFQLPIEKETLSISKSHLQELGK